MLVHVLDEVSAGLANRVRMMVKELASASRLSLANHFRRSHRSALSAGEVAARLRDGFGYALSTLLGQSARQLGL